MNGAVMFDVSPMATRSSQHCLVDVELDGINLEGFQWSDDCMDSILSSNNLDYLTNDLLNNEASNVSVDQDKEDFNRVLEEWTIHLGGLQNAVLHDLDLEEVTSVIATNIEKFPPPSPPPIAPTDVASNFFPPPPLVNAIVSVESVAAERSQQGAHLAVPSQSSVLEALDVDSLLEKFEASQETSTISPAASSSTGPASSFQASSVATPSGALPRSAPAVARRRGNCNGNCSANRPPGTIKIPRFSIILKREPVSSPSPAPATPTTPTQINTHPMASMASMVSPVRPSSASAHPVACPPLVPPPPTLAPRSLATRMVASSPPLRSDQSCLSDHDYCFTMEDEPDQLDTAMPSSPDKMSAPPLMTIPSSDSISLVAVPSDGVVTTLPPSTPPKMTSVLKPIFAPKREPVSPLTSHPESFYSKLPDYYTSIVAQKRVAVNNASPCATNPRQSKVALPAAAAFARVATAPTRPSRRKTSSTAADQCNQRNQNVRANSTCKENNKVKMVTITRVPKHQTGKISTVTAAAPHSSQSPASVKMSTPPVLVPSLTKSGGSQQVRMVVPVTGKRTLPTQATSNKMVVGGGRSAGQTVSKVPPLVVKLEPRYYGKSELSCEPSNSSLPPRLFAPVVVEGVGPISDHHDGRATRWRHRSRSNGSSRSPSRSISSRSHSRSPHRRAHSRARSRNRSRSSSSSSAESHTSCSVSRSTTKSRPRSRSRHRSRSSLHSRDSSSRCTRDRSSSRDVERDQEAEKQKQIEDRRVVHVGNVKPGTTKADIEHRFGGFGPIENITLHNREHGDCYGFITYRYKADAFQALEHGNDNISLPQYELSLGGRRLFCLNRYADLDSLSNNYEAKPPPILRKKNEVIDFDALLQAAKRKSKQGC